MLRLGLVLLVSSVSLELSPSVESCGCGLGPSPVRLGALQGVGLGEELLHRVHQVPDAAGALAALLGCRGGALAHTHIHQVSDAIQQSHPLLSPSAPAFNLSQHQGLFQS